MILRIGIFVGEGVDQYDARYGWGTHPSHPTNPQKDEFMSQTKKKKKNLKNFFLENIFFLNWKIL